MYCYYLNKTIMQNNDYNAEKQYTTNHFNEHGNL
jgi:hypothetical protein